MARRPGELSVKEMAGALEVHWTTVQRWARGASSDGPTKLGPDGVRKDIAGRYWIRETEVERIQAAADAATIF